MRFLFSLQCEKLIILHLCLIRNFQIFLTKLTFLNQTMHHSLKYSFNMKWKKPTIFHLVQTLLFKSMEFTGMAFSPTQVMDDSCSRISQHTKHAQVVMARAIHSWLHTSKIHSIMRAYITCCVFCFWDREEYWLPVEWVVKHYWLGDELQQQEHLILVFFFVSNHAPQYPWNCLVPLKTQQLFFGFGKKKKGN